VGGRHLLLVAVALGIGAQSAAGATITYRSGEGYLTYQAAPGEANRLTVQFDSPRDVTFDDAGAEVSAPKACRRVDAHRATCQLDAPLNTMHVSVRDAVDSVRIDGAGHLEAASIAGGDGGDTLEVMGVLNSTLTGGPGADTLRGSPGAEDEVNYSGATAPIRIDLPAGTAGDDRLFSIEEALGGQAGDTFIGTDGDNSFSGGDGADVIAGNGGDDDLTGDRGNDVVFGGAGNDFLYGFDGRDLLFAGDGDDRVNTADGLHDRADTVGCGAGQDFVEASRPAHARVRNADLFTTDCEALDLGLRAGVTLPTHPLSATAFTLGINARRAMAARLLVKDGPRFVGSARRRIRAGQLRARLAPEGRRLAALGITTPVLVRLRLGKRTATFRLLLPPPQ
jgi:hypothetical protein